MKLSIIFTLLIYSCSQVSLVKERTISLTALKDSCYFLSDSANRKFQIIENTFQDTVALGFGILYPRYTGNFTYLKTGDGMIYQASQDQKLSSTGSFCIGLYQNRKVKGKVVIKYSTQH